MSLRVNGTVLGTVEVRAANLETYSFNAPGLRAGSTVEVVYTNDGAVNGTDRNLIVAYVTDGKTTVVPSQPGVQLDNGAGSAAFDGLDVVAGQEVMFGNGALRLSWPAAASWTPSEREASRLLQQATFGPTRADIAHVASIGASAWLAEQMALPVTADFVNFVQSKYDLSSSNLPPTGSTYTPELLEHQFWRGAAAGRDQLRKRIAFALQQVFVASLTDGNLFHHSRAYANYLDTLNKHALGNFRDLLEEVATSPVMGLYLSHIRNQKEDPSTNRLPDENFARELMQLFTIGLHELNLDGSVKLDAQGRPIETYNNNDVMALAKVFSGWSWGFDDAGLTQWAFLHGSPDYAAQGGARVDMRRMKSYPGLASQAEKKLFTGSANAVVIPANASSAQGLTIALDALFKHPNVGPFMARQLIQRLVTSNPSGLYVARVARVFNDNGSGVRGDLGAVVRAVLLDAEARNTPEDVASKIREPILRVSHWMRAFETTSLSREYMLARELIDLNQRVFYSPSVFNFFRPGYVPPNTSMSPVGMSAPEMQIVNESTTANWINLVQRMLDEGLGWYGSARDVTSTFAVEKQLVAAAPDAFVSHLNLLLFDGRMSEGLRRNIHDAMAGIDRSSPNRNLARVKVAILLAMASPEYLVQN